MLDPLIFDPLAAGLAPQQPIALLPVRLETRFDLIAMLLHIRIYPDEIVADTHEPDLTQTEWQAGLRYWNSFWNVPEDRAKQDAWRQLVRGSTSPRAAWIARRTTPLNAPATGVQPEFPATPPFQSQTWTRPALAQALPDLWLAVAYRGGSEVHRAVSEAVKLPLTLTVSPKEDKTSVDLSGEGLEFDSDLLWSVDYGAALAAGMAIDMAVDSTDIKYGFERLIVLGLSGRGPFVGAINLQNLFEAHHYTRGWSFVKQGTPTNNTEAASSGFPTPDPDLTISLGVEQEAPLPVKNRDGGRLMEALGLDPELVSHVAGADGQELEAAQAMAGALWPATFGNFIRHLMAPIFEGMDGEISAAQNYFAKYVHGRGALSAFRIGNVPYGVLPVTSLQSYQPSQFMESQFGRSLPAALRGLLPGWLSGVPGVPRLNQTSDADGDLLAVLGMDGSAREVRVRNALGPGLLMKLYEIIGKDWTSLRNAMMAVANVYAMIGKNPDWMSGRVTWMSFTVPSFRFNKSLVADVSTETAPLDPNYVEWIRKATLADLHQEKYPDGAAAPVALLYRLLRHSALVLYTGLAYDFMILRGVTPRVEWYERYDREFWDIANTHPRSTIWEYLTRDYGPLTAGLPLGEYLLWPGNPDWEGAAIQSFQRSLQTLETLPVAELERLFTETLDVCSHRLDAWVSSLAIRRLEEMRRNEPRGIHVGAYGWVENLRVQLAPTESVSRGRTAEVQTVPGGHMLAPSMTHAATAAILRNGYLTRGGAGSTEYAVNLSSARVRTARFILDSVRNGQPLGAVLGYQFERGLHDRKVEKYIAPFRRLFPLVANKGTPSSETLKEIVEKPSEAIAARNVVDGLRLRAAWRDKKLPWKSGGLPEAGADAALDAELARLDDAVDAVADLLTAESVFQIARGNTQAATATMDAMAQGFRPPEPDLLRVSQPGTPVTHRVGIVLGHPPLSFATGWASTSPRAQAEPYLNAWVGSLLGDPGRLQCRVKVHAPDASTKEVAVSAADLRLAPLDFLAVATQAAPQPEDSELDRRVARAALKGGAATRIEISYADAAGANRAQTLSFADAIELSKTVVAGLSGARPLKPDDLRAPEQSSSSALNVEEFVLRANESRQALFDSSTKLSDALAAVGDATAPAPAQLQAVEAELVQLSLFGLHGAYPPADGLTPKDLVSMSQAILSEAGRRLKQAGPPVSISSPPDDDLTVRQATKLLQAIFGDSFLALPTFLPPHPEQLTLALAHGPVFASAPKEQAVQTWFQAVSRVRPALARWHKLQLYATALGRTRKPPDIVQLPFRAGADEGHAWVATTLPPAKSGGRTSCVLQRPATPGVRENWAGLLIDEWTEMIPLPEQQAAVSFHYDNSGAEAPQTILLAVQPEYGAPWDTATVLSILLETMNLMQIRAVDLELLGTFGQLLPIICLADTSTKPADAPMAATTFEGALAANRTIVPR